MFFYKTRGKLAKTDVTTRKKIHKKNFTPISVSFQAASAFWPWMLGFQVRFSSELGGKYLGKVGERTEYFST